MNIQKKTASYKMSFVKIFWYKEIFYFLLYYFKVIYYTEELFDSNFIFIFILCAFEKCTFFKIYLSKTCNKHALKA